MRRHLGWIAIGWLVLLGALALVAYGSPSPHPSLSEQARSVAAQIRCPACHGETVEESQTAIAASIRRLIRSQLAAGRTPAEIESFLVSRYGSQILLSPPASGIGDIAWLAPPLLVVGGFGLLVTLVADWRRRARRPPRRAADEYLERVRAELAMEGPE
ncbi:MAG TPA: cytochrome c-type biogenesis protein CcmH [Chloroflexota bacterium]|nr:cytochrome c-type biogenesis protein CcmH [Chloroflexota bacterium]